jgi:hypothetical protein
LGLVSKLAVELGKHPKEPIRIRQNYFWQRMACVFAERERAPRHCALILQLLDDFASAKQPVPRGNSLFSPNLKPRCMTLAESN